LAVSEQTFYRWRKEFGGLKLSQAQRLRGLERENELLRHLVADLVVANQQLKDQAGKDA
jgi:putative transposase